MNKQKLHDLRVFAAEIRLETLKIIGSRGFGHVGCHGCTVRRCHEH